MAGYDVLHETEGGLKVLAIRDDERHKDISGNIYEYRFDRGRSELIFQQRGELGGLANGLSDIGFLKIGIDRFKTLQQEYPDSQRAAAIVHLKAALGLIELMEAKFEGQMQLFA